MTVFVLPDNQSLSSKTKPSTDGLLSILLRKNTGSIPAGLGELGALEHLHLTNNELHGEGNQRRCDCRTPDTPISLSLSGVQCLPITYPLFFSDGPVTLIWVFTNTLYLVGGSISMCSQNMWPMLGDDLPYGFNARGLNLLDRIERTLFSQSSLPASTFRGFRLLATKKDVGIRLRTGHMSFFLYPNRTRQEGRPCVHTKCSFLYAPS